VTLDTETVGVAGHPTGGERRRRVQVRSVWVGIGILAFVTWLFTWFWHTQLFSYNTFLLAVVGAVALNVLVGTAGILSLGNASFMCLGAFGAVSAMNVGIPLPLQFLVAGCVAALGGVVIGVSAARLRGFHMALATLAGYFIVNHLAYQYQSRSEDGGAAGFLFDPLYLDRGLEGGQQAWAWTLFIVVACVLLLVSRLVSERSGRAFRMIRDHDLAAGAIGIHATGLKLTVFAVTSFIIGCQGALLAYLMGSVTHTTFTLGLAVSYLAMVFIGGVDSILGSVIGAALLTSIPVFVPDVVVALTESQASTTGPAASAVVAGLLLVFFTAVAPRGIVGLVSPVLGKVGQRWFHRRAPLK
jgi:branched-chain amino acid transport system permease protein